MKRRPIPAITFKNTTILLGYGLFSLSLIALTISTILPMGSLFFSPGVRHLNVAIFLISLTASVVLPPLVSYIIGYRVTHSELNSERRFNGVLFGIAAYWVSEFFGLIGSGVISDIRDVLPEPLATVVVGWPIIATIAVMAIVAVAYAKNQKYQPSLLANKVYQTVLFAGIIAILGYFILNNNYDETTLLITCLLYIAIPITLIALSYGALPTSKFNPPIVRLTIAGVAVSLGFAASAVASQLLTNAANAVPQLIVGAIVISTYLLLVRRIE